MQASGAEDYDQLFAGDAKPLPVSYHQHLINTDKATIGPLEETIVCGGNKLHVASWNLLAPCYKRGSNESVGSNWATRLEEQQAALSDMQPSLDLILLQEVWQNKAYLAAWRQWATNHGYDMITAPRTSSKQDGCCTFVRGLPIQAIQAWSYADWGDRIVLGVNATLEKQSIWILNTHLTFPHPNDHDPVMRIHQARKLSKLMRSEPLSHAVQILGGDLNGEIDDDAVRQIFDTSTGITPHTTDKGWVSHVAHNGAHMGCDFFGLAAPASSSGATAAITGYELIGDFERGLSDHLLLLAEISLQQESGGGRTGSLSS
jgi:endonuclease/exonuclease/phosphatase family metal-dependent hydrolase